MRPRLDPRMGQVVICARVAVQLAFWRYRHHEGMKVAPGTHCRFVLRILPDGINPMLRLALHSLGVYLDLGYSSSQWLECVLTASHYGSSFRRCFFFDYKEQRRAYPRVTNRGVHTSIEGSSTFGLETFDYA
jgi:hypothetical protein